MTQFLAELVIRAWAILDLDYYRLCRFRQAPLAIAQLAAGEWVLVFHLLAYFTQLLHFIGMTSVIASHMSRLSHSSAKLTFAISEVIGFFSRSLLPRCRHGSPFAVHQYEVHLEP